VSLGFGWLVHAAQEAMLGVLIGFGLASFLWGFTAAGDIVDSKVGQGLPHLHDAAASAFSGTSGAWLGRLAACWFMAAGGLGVFLRVLADSFRIWPVGRGAWQPAPDGLIVLQAWFAEGSVRALLLAAPVLVALFAIDLVLGLINRFAPQIPLIALSASIKSWAAVAMWLLMLGTLGDGFEGALQACLASLLPGVRRIWPGPG
jgi:type III secretion protein T